MIRGCCRDVVLGVIRRAAARDGMTAIHWCESAGEGRAVIVGAPHTTIADAKERGYFRVVAEAIPAAEFHAHDGELCPTVICWDAAIVRVTVEGKLAALDELVEAN